MPNDNKKAIFRGKNKKNLNKFWESKDAQLLKL